MRAPKTVSQVRQAYADARRRFEKKRQWIERGSRTTNRAREVRPIAIAWAQLMIPPTLRQKRFLNGNWTSRERQDGGFDVELRAESRLIPLCVELRPLSVPDAKRARRETCADAHGHAPLEYDIRIVKLTCQSFTEDWSLLGALPRRRNVPRPLPNGKRSIESLDDEQVFRLDILRVATERARKKGGPQRKVLRDWYILRAIAGLCAIGYRAAAACELVLEEVTGYKAATLYKVLAHARARDDAAEGELTLELSELREYKARSKVAIKEILSECIAYRYCDRIRDEVQDVRPILYSRIREAEAKLRAIRERRYAYHPVPRIPPTVPSP